MINSALKDHDLERKMLAHKAGLEAVILLDYKLCDTRKKLNAFQHDTRMKEKRMEELEAKYCELVGDQRAAQATDVGESEEGMHLRTLENRLDKALLKCTEAEHIKGTYEQIKWKLHEEHLQFENTLKQLEHDIRRAKDELKELKRMKADADMSRDAAVKELRKQEEQHYKDKKDREKELQNKRKEAEEKRTIHERTERRIVRPF